MKLPYLEFWDVTPVTVTITNGIDENGAPAVVATYVGNCNYSEKSNYALSSDGQRTKLSGTLTIGCDIAPSVGIVEGTVTINGVTNKIFGGSRPRNPDGTVNHTTLELI